jgi:hypothetical protein
VPACQTQAPDENGDEEAGMHTCPPAQSAGPTGDEGAHARAVWSQTAAGSVAAPPVAPHVPLLTVGPATVTDAASGLAALHVVVTVRVPSTGMVSVQLPSM